MGQPSWSRFFKEFYCRGCGFQQAYRSRPRSLFEKLVLPLFLFQPVRCERCYRRTYALRSIAVLERGQPARRPAQSASDDPGSDSRVA